MLASRMDSYYRDFGANVRGARGDLSQARLAEAAGLTRAAVANIETGRQRVTLDVLDRIARALGVPPASLLPPSPAEPRRASVPHAHRAVVARLLTQAGISSDDDAPR